MYVIHCWNGCTDMFYNCVIFVILIDLFLNENKMCKVHKENKRLHRTHGMFIETGVYICSGKLKVAKLWHSNPIIH